MVDFLSWVPLSKIEIELSPNLNVFVTTLSGAFALIHLGGIWEINLGPSFRKKVF